MQLQSTHDVFQTDVENLGSTQRCQFIYVSPQLILPVPTAGTCGKRKSCRKKRKAATITESPYKNELIESLSTRSKSPVKKNLQNKSKKDKSVNNPGLSYKKPKKNCTENFKQSKEN